MTGKSSWGSYVQQEFQKECTECRIEWVTNAETAGLLGRLRTDRRGRRKPGYEVVLGIEEIQYQIARSEKLLEEGIVFNESPFALIVDTQKFPSAEWPSSWKELASKARHKILAQDPRLSGPGVGWLRAIFSDRLLSLEEARQATFAVFPSWSASYQAFMSEKAPLVWSFLGSEAYHLCHGESRYKALPLKEGYPLYKERVALVAGVKSSVAATRFVSFVLSEKVQKLIPEMNWMFPGRADTPLPTCFKDVTKLKSLPVPENVGSAELRTWTDSWGR